MTPRDTKNQPAVCTALLVAIIILLALAVMVTGCTRTTYVPVESVRTEYVGADTTALMRLVGYLREQVRSKDRAIDSLMQSYRSSIGHRIDKRSLKSFWSPKTTPSATSGRNWNP